MEILVGELETLELNDCGLHTIEASAFRGLAKMQYLYLAANHLSSLPRATFQDVEGTGKLRYLIKCCLKCFIELAN